MTTEQSKTASPAASEHPFPPTANSASASVPPTFSHFTGAYPPTLPPGYPPFFAFPPPITDGQQGEGNSAPLPYSLLYPPGMVYTFPPQPVPSATPAVSSAFNSRPKRRQVKMACTNCAAACKRCDEARPCERCKKYGFADTCVDGQRKERKKGIKRGPYKRKNKSSEDNYEYSTQPSDGGEWSQGSPPPPSTAATSTTIHPVAQLPPVPEGLYPIYLPPGYALPEPQPNGDGSTPSGPTLVPFYIGGFAPYGYPPGAVFQLPPPGTHPPPPPSSETTTVEAGAVPAAAKDSTEVVLDPSVAPVPTPTLPSEANKDQTKGSDDIMDRRPSTSTG
ncbi:hypothetical protein DFJ43DRAFT_1050627 [Lentinula guzmanii]|uniref:Zn(2)-C6 fungal-type domain-containing protein n=1 Tax=Lentinula guzmanii TaxID=2804957 RepID=A0AA38JIX2_9AGAR|nr:hypothetical protein DFJ43DRAFT_1050627 [Lentinula guzmanii]